MLIPKLLKLTAAVVGLLATVAGASIFLGAPSRSTLITFWLVLLAGAVGGAGLWGLAALLDQLGFLRRTLEEVARAVAPAPAELPEAVLPAGAAPTGSAAALPAAEAGADVQDESFIAYLSSLTEDPDAEPAAREADDEAAP